MRPGFGRGGAEQDVRPGICASNEWAVTYNAHVGDGFFILSGGGAPSSSVLVLGSREVHEFD